MNERLKILPEGVARPVRVAVLDTGCDLSVHFFNGPGIRQEERLTDHWLDCLDESNEPVDVDRGHHGTAMVTLLLRLLPSAEIYVARVSKDSNGLPMAKKNVEKVLKPRIASLLIADGSIGNPTRSSRVGC